MFVHFEYTLIPIKIFLLFMTEIAVLQVEMFLTIVQANSEGIYPTHFFLFFLHACMFHKFLVFPT